MEMPSLVHTNLNDPNFSMIYESINDKNAFLIFFQHTLMQLDLANYNMTIHHNVITMIQKICHERNLCITEYQKLKENFQADKGKGQQLEFDLRVMKNQETRLINLLKRDKLIIDGLTEENEKLKNQVSSFQRSSSRIFPEFQKSMNSTFAQNQQNSEKNKILSLQNIAPNFKITVLEKKKNDVQKLEETIASKNEEIKKLNETIQDLIEEKGKIIIEFGEREVKEQMKARELEKKLKELEIKKNKFILQAEKACIASFVEMENEKRSEEVMKELKPELVNDKNVQTSLDSTSSTKLASPIQQPQEELCQQISEQKLNCFSKSINQQQQNSQSLKSSQQSINVTASSILTCTETPIQEKENKIDSLRPKNIKVQKNEEVPRKRPRTESRNDEIQETFIDSTTAKSTSNFVTPVTQRCSQKRQRNITSTASSILTIANTTIQETPDGSDLLTQRSEKPVKVYRCKWAICNSQFDCIEALYEHIKTSHTSNKVKGQYICLWKSCKEKDAFQSVNRLNRHIRDKLKKKN